MIALRLQRQSVDKSDERPRRRRRRNRTDGESTGPRHQRIPETLSTSTASRNNINKEEVARNEPLAIKGVTQDSSGEITRRRMPITRTPALKRSMISERELRARLADPVASPLKKLILVSDFELAMISDYEEPVDPLIVNDGPEIVTPIIGRYGSQGRGKRFTSRLDFNPWIAQRGFFTNDTPKLAHDLKAVWSPILMEGRRSPPYSSTPDRARARAPPRRHISNPQSPQEEENFSKEEAGRNRRRRSNKRGSVAPGVSDCQQRFRVSMPLMQRSQRTDDQ